MALLSQTVRVMGVSLEITLTDAKIVVDLLSKENSTNLTLEPLHFDFKGLLKRFSRLKLDHVFCETNRSADALSKLGTYSDQTFILHPNPSPVVVDLLASDLA
ncbi:putative ribonuclease h protein [Fagus crenata]